MSNTSTVTNGSAVGGAGSSNALTVDVPVDDAAKTYTEFGATRLKAEQDAAQKARELYESQWKADRRQRDIFFYFYIAQMAASIFATVEAYRAYKKYLNRQESLLAFQQQAAERLDARYNAHFAPVEDAYMDELGRMRTYVPRYQMVSDLMRQGAIRSFDLSKEVILKTRTRYCAGLTGHQFKQITIARAMAESDAVSMAYRYEDAIENNRNMDRHNKLVAMFGIGRNLFAQALTTAGNAASAYGALASNAQAGLNQGISGIFSSAGSIISNRSAQQSSYFQSPESSVGNAGPAIPSYRGIGGFSPENNFSFNSQQRFDLSNSIPVPSLSAGLGLDYNQSSYPYSY